MTGFDLPTNFIDDREALLKRTKAKLKRVSALESKDNRTRRSLTLEFEAITNKTLHEFSAPSTTNIRTRPAVDVGDNGFELKPTLINMVKPTSFMERHMKMLVHISNTFLRSVALLLSREYPRMPFYSAFSHSHF
jgi:hypothetical protein